jgi:Tol biopolymer transport system component
MPLDSGTRLGPYEITGQLGAGGMGEVCRARDTKLNRDVALKVLPETFATDPDRMSRFQREAQLLASLNHPNIAGIYGLEDGGSRRAIVMELVEGQTLTGPLPIDDALRIAKQITDAIEYAHDRGIIHRDLKPANIKVTPDGTVKVLDFGLAKAMDQASDSAISVHGSMSPTLSLGATYAGVIMGTAAYMAPEQAKGRPADRRSDVWAFGVVLYEMLTGARMFGGDSVPETLASVMKDQITFGSLPEETPTAIRKLVSRCLERDPRRRLQSIGEARIVIEDVIAGVAVEEGEPQPAAVPRSVAKWPWVVAAASLLAAIGAFGWTWSRPGPTPPAVTRFNLPPAEGTTITSTNPNASTIAVSPNGRYVAFIADEGGRERTIWVRALDSLSAQRLDRTEGAMFPFWSPDSQHIAYFVGGKLMRISVAGGAPLTICDAPNGEGGTWFQTEGQDGVIIFAPQLGGALMRVLAQGGVPTQVTTLAKDEIGHSFPQFLPDGQRFLYLSRGTKAGIYVQTLGSDERTFVVESIGRAAFSPPGLLLYLRDNTLLAHRWNLDTLRLEGEPVSIAEDVRSGGTNGRNAFAISATGVLAYRGGGSLGNFEVGWYTRDGKPESVVLEPGEFGQLELSPDDKRLTILRGTGNERDLWLKDLTSGVFSRLTTATGSEIDPIWSPDSRRVGYISFDGNKRTLYETLIGSGKHTEVPTRLKGDFAWEGWTPDGKQLVIRVRSAVSLIPAPQESTSASGEGPARTVFNEAYGIDQVRISPDGKWVAYMSLESGQPEINVASFPAFTDRRQISIGTDGAVQPLWRADGKELFFIGRDQTLMAVDVKPGATLETGMVRPLFRTGITTSSQVYLYAVARDGKRFLIRQAAGREGGQVEQLNVVTNWMALVR